MQRQGEARGSGAFVPTAKWINGVASFINDFRVTGSNGIRVRQDGPRVSISFVDDIPTALIYRTCDGPDDAPYPEPGDNPTNYYAELLKVSFDEESVDAELEAEGTGSFAYVFNRGKQYITEGTDIDCYSINGQLYTDYNPLTKATTTTEHASGETHPVTLTNDQEVDARNEFASVPEGRTVYVKVVNGVLCIVSGDPC